jgi:GNAT superfamily N-acetyltransferase
MHRIERLTKAHDRSRFGCGVPLLDDFIHRYATQYDRRGVARTFVAVLPGTAAVVGYYSLSAGGVPFDSIPADVAKRLPRHPLPIIVLGRLAVDLQAQKQGLGERLLHDAFRRCLTVADQLGVHSVFVEAIDDQAANFYSRYGFVPFSDQPNQLFLPLEVIQASIGNTGAP